MLGSCTFSGRAWRLWASRHTQGERSGHWALANALGAGASRASKAANLTAFDHSGADQRMFRSWWRTQFTALQCVLIVSWAVWWNVVNPMGEGVSWGGRVYNGLVPNLLVCTLAVRARCTYLAPTFGHTILTMAILTRCAPSSASSGRAVPSRTSG